MSSYAFAPLRSLLDFAPLKRSTTSMLTQTYTLLAISFALCTLAVCSKAAVSPNVATVVGMGSLLYILWNKHRAERIADFRAGVLFLFAYCKGIMIQSYIIGMVQVHPDLVFKALVTTSSVFLSFTAGSLISTRREGLYLGGYLFTGTSVLLLARLLNFSLDVELVAGLFLFCGYLVFDTQNMIHKAENNGIVDPVVCAAELYTDTLAIFLRLLRFMERRRKRKQ